MTTGSSDVRPGRTTIPGDLLWAILWAAFSGCLWILFAVAEKSAATRTVFIGLGVVHLVLAVSLYALAPWARSVGAVVFGLSAGIRVLSMLIRGFTASKLFFAIFAAWWCVYLLLPSTRRLFESKRRARLNVPAILTAIVMMLAIVALAFAVPALKLSRWTVYVGGAGLVVLWLLFEARLTAAFARLLARRPSDVAPADWPAFRAARRALDEGNPAEAARLATPLPDGFSVQLLRDLIAAAAARARGGLHRAIFDGGFEPDPAEKKRIAGEVWEPDTRRLLDTRARLIDALVEDSSRDRPLIADFEAVMQQLTGDVIVHNADHEHRVRWIDRRPRCTGDRASEWLLARLWGADCLQAAHAVAERLPDEDLRAAAALSAAIDEMREGGMPGEWWVGHLVELSQVPLMADVLQTFVIGGGADLLGGAAGGVLRQRLRLVARLQRFQEEYVEVCGIEPRWLLSRLTGYELRLLKSYSNFVTWWQDEGKRQGRHDDACVRGLEAAEAEDWTAAERAFAEAQEAWPGRTTAVHNRAIALTTLERYDEADGLFKSLSGKRPDDTILLMHHGDCLRKAGRLQDAVALYERAVREGGFEDEIALRLGVTLAEDDQDDRAAKAFEKVLGRNPTAESLESLANLLEEQGAYRLSQRYRDEAMLRGLGSKSDVDEDDEGVGV